MDCCRSAIRCGAEKVYVLYRRTEAEMPANPIEIHESKLEGVEYLFLTAPIKVYKNDKDLAQWQSYCDDADLISVAELHSIREGEEKIKKTQPLLCASIKTSSKSFLQLQHCKYHCVLSHPFYIIHLL